MRYIARACLKTTQCKDKIFASSRGSFGASNFGKFSSDSCISEENCSDVYAQNSLRSKTKSFKTGSNIISLLIFIFAATTANAQDAGNSELNDSLGKRMGLD